MVLQRMYRIIFANLALSLGILIVLAFALVAVAAPWLAPPEDEPFQIPRDGIGVTPLPPRPGHPLGTLAHQYDVFYGIVWGTRVAFVVGVLVTVGRALVGILVGLLSGYYGGWLDRVLMRLTDAFMAFPILAVAMVVLTWYRGVWWFTWTGEYTLLGSKLERLVILTLIAFGWMQYARLIRGNVLVERDKEYVQAARSIGAPSWRIIRKHVFPNATQGLFALMAADIGAVVVLMTVLNFLGLTSNASGNPTANWGEMLNVSRDWMVGTPGQPFAYWYTYVPPALAIVFFSMGWNLVGDGLRNLLDPRLRRSRAASRRAEWRAS